MFWKLSEMQRPFLRQMLASVSIGLVISCLLATLALPAVALPQMMLPESTINFTSSQASWFATLQLLPTIPGALVGGALCEFFGPRRLTLVLVPVLFISFSFMAVTSWPFFTAAGLAETLLLTCRGAQGIAVAILLPVCYTYTYEMNDAKRRGTMTGLSEVWTTLGFLLCYVLGCFFRWETISWVIPVVTAGPAFVGVLLCHESPSWLARKGREKEALEALTKLRLSTEEAQEEVAIAKKSAENDVSFWKALRELRKKSNFVSMVLSALIIVMKECSGNSGIAVYIVQIFEFAGVGLQSNLSSVVVGSVRLLCNCLSTFLMHNVPRKPVLCIGTIMVAIGTTSLGVFFALQSHGYDVSHLGWLPLTSLVVYIIGYSGAEGPFCWVISVDVLPTHVRAIGCGITQAVYGAVAFTVSKTFTSMQDAVGLHGVFWSYAASSLFLLVIIVASVPETFNMSLRDVEAHWEDVCQTKKRKNEIDLEKSAEDKKGSVRPIQGEF